MDQPVTGTRRSDGSESSLADKRETGRELVSSERVWSGPIFAVDADYVRLAPARSRSPARSSSITTPSPSSPCARGRNPPKPMAPRRSS